MNIFPLGRQQKAKLGFPTNPRNARFAFRGSFYVDGSIGTTSSNVTIDRGYVNGLEPVLGTGNILISGDPNTQIQPALSDTTDSDIAWICLQIAVDPKTGVMVAQNQASVTTANLTISLEETVDNADPSVYHHPIAVYKSGMGITQISYFDFLHISIVVDNIPRHLMIAS